ncbi:hypothetical protein Droror1_Dr00017204 [Drosera rotundifolia]
MDVFGRALLTQVSTFGLHFLFFGLNRLLQSILKFILQNVDLLFSENMAYSPWIFAFKAQILVLQLAQGHPGLGSELAGKRGDGSGFALLKVGWIICHSGGYWFGEGKSILGDDEAVEDSHQVEVVGNLVVDTVRGAVVYMRVDR